MSLRLKVTIAWTIAVTLVAEAVPVYLRFGWGETATEFDKTAPRWRDPVTGRKKSRSTKVERTGAKAKREAERVAAKFEAELREQRYHEPLRTTWADFRRKYEEEKLPSLAKRTDDRVGSVFNWVEKVLNPTRLRV